MKLERSGVIHEASFYVKLAAAASPIVLIYVTVRVQQKFSR